MRALDRAVVAATASFWVEKVRDRRRGGNDGQGDGKIKGVGLNRGTRAPSLALVARAQFFQRWPELFDDLAASACSPETILTEATER